MVEKAKKGAEEILPDYSDYEFEPDADEAAVQNGAHGAKAAKTAAAKPTAYVGVHSTSFKDMLLKPELQQSITDCGFEHPSDVQQRCIPEAMLGVDVLCQAVSGMGKTAVFVITILQCIGESPSPCTALVLSHNRELAYQIKKEFDRFTKFMKDVRTEVIYGGQPIEKQIKMLKSDKAPHIIVGTPGRILDLTRRKALPIENLKMFVLDECDKLLESISKSRFYFDAFRHEKRCPKNFHRDPAQQAGNDVHGNPVR